MWHTSIQGSHSFNLVWDTVKLVPPSITTFLLLTRSLVAIILLIFGLFLLTFLSNLLPLQWQWWQLVQQGHPLDSATLYDIVHAVSKLTLTLQNPPSLHKDPLPFFSLLPLADRKNLWAWEWARLHPLTARSSYRRWDLHLFLFVRLQGLRWGGRGVGWGGGEWEEGNVTMGSQLHINKKGSKGNWTLLSLIASWGSCLPAQLYTHVCTDHWRKDRTRGRWAHLQ